MYHRITVPWERDWWCGRKVNNSLPLFRLCCRSLIEGARGAWRGQWQRMCFRNNSVSGPHVAQCVGFPGKKRCLYSPVGASLVMQCAIRAMAVIESLAARRKKFALVLLQILGRNHFRLHLMASHCRPRYSCVGACAFHHESMFWT